MKDVFRLRDDYLAAHPEIAQAMKDLAWVQWAERQMQGVRIIEQRYKDGKLVGTRDVTPPDPEPER